MSAAAARKDEVAYGRPRPARPARPVKTTTPAKRAVPRAKTATPTRTAAPAKRTSPAERTTPAKRTTPAVPRQRTGGEPMRAAPPEPVTAPRAPFVTLVLLLVVGGIIGLLILNTTINENSFKLHDLRSRQSTLDAREQLLTREIATREAPGNLAAAARRLGLVQAGTPAFIRLPDGRVLGVPRPASAPPPTAPGR